MGGWGGGSGGGSVVQSNILLWRIRLVRGEIRHCRITVLLNVSARARGEAAAPQGFANIPRDRHWLRARLHKQA